MSTTVNIFVSYSHDDQRWIDRLVLPLEQSLRKSFEGYTVKFKSDKDIPPGEPFRDWIVCQINKTDITLLLVSQSWLNSTFINDLELPQIVQRLKNGQLILIPILVGHCTWKDSPLLREVQILPKSTRPVPVVEYWGDEAKQEKVKFEILEEIRTRIQGIISKKKDTDVDVIGDENRKQAQSYLQKYIKARQSGEIQSKLVELLEKALSLDPTLPPKYKDDLKILKMGGL